MFNYNNNNTFYNNTSIFYINMFNYNNTFYNNTSIFYKIINILYFKKKY